MSIFAGHSGPIIVLKLEETLYILPCAVDIPLIVQVLIRGIACVVQLLGVRIPVFHGWPRRARVIKVRILFC